MFEEVCNQLLLQSLRKSRDPEDSGAFRLKTGDENSSSFCC
jgi:hypothetical protein